MNKKIIRIGTRASALALSQSGQVRDALAKANPGHRFELVKIKTLGDEYQSVELFKKSGVGVFTKAIEKALLSREIDIAVHSLKDLPTETARGLVLAAVPKRASIEDVLVSAKKWTLKTLPQNATVGTGSPRRKRQLALLRPDLQLKDLRGNLDTRIRKAVHEKKLDAVVVAKAGLRRLGKYMNYAQVIPADILLSAVGQGALGIQTRAADKDTLRMTKRIHHAETGKVVDAEREFLKTLHGGCRVPVGVHCKISKGKFLMKAAVFSVNSRAFLEAEIRGPLSNARKLAKLLASELLKMGAKKFLTEARATGGLG